MATHRAYLNADHDPTEFAACPHGHATRQFDLPAGKITAREGDWILAYVCDACAEDAMVEGAESGDALIIQIPHLERLNQLRMIARPLSTLAH